MDQNQSKKHSKTKIGQKIWKKRKIKIENRSKSNKKFDQIKNRSKYNMKID